MCFLCLALPWATGIYFLGSHITTLPPWGIFAGVVVFSLPVILSSLYLVTVRKTQNLAGFASQGWIYRLAGGRVVATLFWTVWAILSTFFLLLQFRAYTPAEWLGFFIVIPLFYGIYRLLHRVVRSELKPYRQVADALRIARRVTPFIALIVYVVLLQAIGGLPVVDTLGEAIELRRGIPPDPGGSVLVYELGQFMAYYDGARLFLAAQAGAQGTGVALAMVLLGSWVLFFNASAMLSCFLVPPGEYRRVFARLTDADDPPFPETSRIALTSAIATLVVFFVALPAFAAFESRARQYSQAFNDARAHIETIVVLIDGHPYRPEVVHELKHLQMEVASQLEVIRPQLLVSLEAAFERMENNVDPFLDWYYQLNAEYLRMLNLMRGQLEDFVGSRMKEYLQYGDPFGEFEAQLTQAVALHEQLQSRFSEQSAALLDRHKMALSDEAPFRVAQELSLCSLLEFPAMDETIPFTMRAGTGGTAGIVTSAVVANVVAKIYAKGVVKMAAKPLAKALVMRAAAVGGGMASGAAIGSAVPGVGTVAGAAVGAGVGLVVGVGMDYGLLKLEEALSREAFREQLLEAIREVRAEYLMHLNEGQ